MTSEERRAEIARLKRWLAERESTLTAWAMGVSEEASRALIDNQIKAAGKRARLEELERIEQEIAGDPDDMRDLSETPNWPIPASRN